MTVGIAGQIAAVTAELERTVPPRLMAHIRRVVEEAQTICPYWDVDPERAELAALGHDLYRAVAPEDLLADAKRRGARVTPAFEASPILLHGPLAAMELVTRFGIEDDEVIAAVRDHTSGLAVMSTLAKIILLADKIEKKKRARTPVMGEIRQVARRDLDAALLSWADWKWVGERTREESTDPDHWEARVSWVAEHHAEAGLPERTAEDVE